MNILLVEDDITTRKQMVRFLSEYGKCDLTTNGLEAIDAFERIRNIEKQNNIPENLHKNHIHNIVKI